MKEIPSNIVWNCGRFKLKRMKLPPREKEKALYF
jgi:hypothetical protein